MKHADTIRKFRDPNMPWPGSQCRSRWAGLSGAAYALPALACPSMVEQSMWVLTAFLSMWADYACIHMHSIAHGLDRVYASAIMLRCLVLGAMWLEPHALLLVCVPIVCFARGRDAKEQPTPSAWVFWHTCWHLSGGFCAMVGTYLLHEAMVSDTSSAALSLEAIAPLRQNGAAVLSGGA